MAKSKRQVKKARQRNAARVQNNVRRSSGIGTEYDYGQYQQPGSIPMSPKMQDDFAVRFYYTDWSAKKIVTIPVDDMLRTGWGYKGVTEEQEEQLVDLADRLDAVNHVKSAVRLERLVGGSVVFMGISDGAESPAEPVRHDQLKPGCLRFLNVIPRTRISRVVMETDPLQHDYGRPSHYWINGQQVHRSRLLIFDGDPLLQSPDSIVMPTMFCRNDGFGTSVLIPILDDITRATGTRQAAYQLVQRASVFLYQTDLQDLQGTDQGQVAIARMREIVNQINLFRGAVVDKGIGEGDPVTTISPSFGSVPELVISYLQVLSAASDIPATRFLGQAPGGLNATGESDLENYYGRLESEQHQRLRPQLLKLLRVMGPSVLGEQFDPSAVDVEFEPLWSLSELEMSQIRTADVTNVANLITAGLLQDAEAIEELKLREALKAAFEREPEDLGGGDDVPPLSNVLDQLAEPEL